MYDRVKDQVREIISNSFPEDEICLLLSGGSDSTFIGLVSDELGKKVHTVSFYLQGETSWDFETSKKTSDLMGWNFHGVEVPTTDPKKDFLNLIQTHHCKKKTELEVLFPFIHILEKVKDLGFTKVLTGFSSPLPDSRRDSVQIRGNLNEYWDRRYNEIYDSPATEKCFNYSETIGIELHQPLSDKSVKRLFLGKTWEEIHKPYWKTPWKLPFKEKFEELDLLSLGKTPGLQVGGGIENYFSSLVSDSDINYKGYVKGNTTQRLSHLVQLWSKNPHPKITSTPLVIEYKPYKLEDVYRESSKELFTVVSTFGGGGGSSTGYKLGGGKILLMNEFIPEGVKTYQQNYPDTQIIESDIRKLTRGGGCKKLTEIFNSFGIQRGEYDILDGSPPCSTFSTAGKGKKKILEKNVKYSDTTQDRIGMLIHDFIFMANCTQPKICVMENVPSMMNSDVFQFGLVRLRRSFYINHSVMTSSQFGVPQRRRRLIVVGVRKDIGKKVGIKKDEDILDLYPTGSIYEPTLNDSIRGLDIDKEERNIMLSSVVNSSTYEIIRSIPKNPNKTIGMKSVDPTWTSDFNVVRSSWNQPSPTLTQTGQQISGLGGVIHPTEDRRFTLNELIRLMGLPDDFKLTGTHNQKIERVCRMVSPPIYQYLSKSLYENVLSKV